ncbi:3-isopropylmalate/(R)-2-methylmalate dehydratase large subunit [Solibacillus kalamii]|uniref:3-isopropylmalate dehydratase large subunit n=1 Tax=Solibacillus kalamii TaxID=1748298 RepID=A0ABX3ZIP5_9BACL|nr:3-isopropylmalate dehydratase large subunit [Solibacillus kalamii]MBM7663844.1 3-isopropylmalate/(R)-2-methylmalate dehydratase large subunit [Solibacillus kalamii]OUZ39476.1 3-isopropylmalate dehydratase large subunit [Solibacillus kalamii]
MGKNIIEKVWEQHVVHREEGKPDLLYIDLHLIHEVTSPQAFEGLRLAGRKVRRTDLSFATMDHNVPTKNLPTINDPIAKKQIMTLAENAKEFGIELADIGHPDQGIVHVIGPELGLTQPGKTIVCGDSHTATHGAFGAIAFGIGTSEVEHVLSTQTLWQLKPPTMEIRVNGELGVGVTAKDIILAIIAKWGIGVGTGHIVEYTGEAIGKLSMEERMTICNMSIEAGAKAGLISPDETTVEFLRGRRHVPQGDKFEEAAKYWLSLASDADATYDVVLEIDAQEIEPIVTWGTNPAMGVGVSKTVPTAADYNNETDRSALNKALKYMDLQEGQKITDIEIQHVFIGSCTNSRINDLRAAAEIVKGEKLAPGVNGIVVPGSWSTKRQAEEEGLHLIFLDAGFEWRESGCSACLGMNEDVIPAGERCASTSNRNFEGRQGAGARTHLVSPAMAAAAAIHGRFVDVRKLQKQEA